MKHLTLYLLLLVSLASTTTLHAQTQVGADIDGEAANDQSGYSVSLSGDRLAVGALRNDGNGTDAGHVRVYDLVAGAWQQVGNDIDGEAFGDKSGQSVSLSGDRLAIGATGNDGNGSFAGHVRVYELVAGAWQQVGSDIDGEAAGDESGWSVSMSGDRLAVGAPLNDGNASAAGHARVYELVAGAWQQVGADIDGEASSDQSGWSVSLSGDRVAVGAPFNAGNGFDAGRVRVYDLVAGAWQQVGADIDGETAGDRSGWSVSLSGDRLAVGAYLNDGNGSDAGHVRVYELVAGAWQQVGADIDGETAGDRSGWSVSLSGDRLAVGVYLNDGNGSRAGHARVYELVAGAWQQVGADIDGEAAGDQSGYSVSLSGDRLAVGAHFNDGNGSNAGHVRVYDLPTATLPVTLTAFDAYPALEDVHLRWTTASEVNASHFDVEHSRDGR